MSSKKLNPLEYPVRKCLKCEDKGKWRFLCPKCIRMNNVLSYGLIPQATKSIIKNIKKGDS